MGAYIHNIYIAYKDNGPKTFTVHYTDNGYRDSIQATFNNDLEALGWLNSWGGDTSGGFEHLINAKKCLNLPSTEEVLTI